MAKTNSPDPKTEENRKKSDTRFWFRLLSVTIIVPVYTALVVCMLVMPRSTISMLEKRELATFPEFSWKSYFSGEYTAAIANYFDDTVPFRDTLKQAGSQLTNFLGIKYNNVQVSGQMYVVNNDSADNNDISAESTAAVTESKAADSTSSKASSDSESKKDTDTEKSKPKGQEIADGVFTNGTIVVYQDGHYRAMSMYGGGSGEVYAAALNGFANDLPGVRVYSMIAPTPSEFYTPKNFSDYNASQENDIKAINSMLNNVKGINICPTLADHVDETIYTRTDHHWMSLGAYYAAKDFANVAGVPFADISKYDKESIPGYVGTMYNFSDNNADLLNDPEDFIYYKPKNSYKTEYYTQSFSFSHEADLLQYVADSSSLYMTYMGGDGYVTKITTDVKNGRRLCVVKDSYGNAEIPFYTSSFEEIYVIDMRYFELNLVDFCKDMNITDLLFTMCTYSAVGTNADNLENLRTGGGSVPSEDEIIEEEPAESEASSPEEDNNDYTADGGNDNEDNNNNDYGYDEGSYDEGYYDDGYYEDY